MGKPNMNSSTLNYNTWTLHSQQIGI